MIKTYRGSWIAALWWKAWHLLCWIFFFPGKFRRDLQLDQNLSKDKSEGDYLPWWKGDLRKPMRKDSGKLWENSKKWESCSCQKEQKRARRQYEMENLMRLEIGLWSPNWLVFYWQAPFLLYSIYSFLWL